jgi:hypothetical protein
MGIPGLIGGAKSIPGVFVTECEAGSDEVVLAFDLNPFLYQAVSEIGQCVFRSFHGCNYH